MSATIIITTFNRPSYLRRLLSFYENLNIKFNILILDSSSDNSELINLCHFNNHQKIKYLRFDSSISISEKIKRSLPHVKTKYVLLCADDDFIFPSAIELCIRFLHENSSYASCHGLYYNHLIINCFGRYGLHLRPLYSKGISLEDDLGIERVSKYLLGKSVYYPFYAVHHTETFVRIWSRTAEVVEDWGLSEICPSALSLAYGKMKILNHPYASREVNANGWIDLDKHKNLYSTSKVDKVINLLADELSGFRDQAMIDKLNRIFEFYLLHSASKLQNNDEFNIKRLYENIRKKIAIRNKFGFMDVRSNLISGLEFLTLKKSILSTLGFENEVIKSRENY